MVQFFLRCALCLAMLAPAVSARSRTAPAPDVSELQMEGGRRLVFERSFSSQREVRTKRGFWTKLKDAVVGEPEYRSLLRPYGIVTDSRGRVIVADPGSYGVHIFDFAQQKYKFLSHADGEGALRAPECLAVDRQDNIYITDPEAGKIFVFGADGKFQRAIGSLRGGEGIFKRPTGIAVDSDAGRIYVSDTWRHKIFMLDMQGSVVQTIGKQGAENGEFNYPTELRLEGQELFVVDAMNFRIQVLDRAGKFRYAIGQGAGDGGLFRPKGAGVDSEGHLYVADGFRNIVQVFDRDDRLLYYFGQKAGVGDFRMPASLSVDHSDRIWVVDSYHRKIEVFHYFGLNKPAMGGAR